MLILKGGIPSQSDSFMYNMIKKKIDSLGNEGCKTRERWTNEGRLKSRNNWNGRIVECVCSIRL